MIVATKCSKKGVIEIYPKFIIKKSSDLMIRGGDFYAIWIEERGLWSTDEQDALQLIDKELDTFAKENKDRFEGTVKILHMWDAESGMIDSWHKYFQTVPQIKKIMQANDLIILWKKGIFQRMIN